MLDETRQLAAAFGVVLLFGLMGVCFAQDFNRSDVEVETELPRVRPQPYRVDLALALVVDPGVDQVARVH